MMEYVGIDLHKVNGQVCVQTETGEYLECRIRTDRERFAAVLGKRPRARVLLEASTESEWVALSRGARARGDRRRSQLRADVRESQQSDQN
jgi:hypothetical protein